MAEAFIDHLARALAVPPAEAEDLLGQIGRHLREQIEATGEARIEGVGTFRREDDGVAFEPDEALALAVNHRYAGLSPIEAAAPRRRAAPPPVDPFAAEPEPELHLPPEPPTPPIRDLTTEAPAQPTPEGPSPTEAGETAPAEPGPRELEPDALEPEVPAIASEAEAFETEPESIAPEGEEIEPEVSETEAEEIASEAEPPLLPPEASTEPEAEPELSEELEQGAVVSDTGEPEADEPEAGEEPTPEEIDAMIAGVWTPRTGPDEGALGAPPEALEEAEFSVMDEAPEPEPPVRIEGLEAREPAPPPPPPMAPAVAATAQVGTLSEARREHVRETRRPSRTPVIAAAVVVLIVGVAALVWLLSEGDAGDDVAAGPSASDTVAAAAPAADSAALAADTSALAAAAEPIAPEPEPPASAPPSASADPLRGGELDPAGEGFTWVVASEASRATAEQKAARYRAQGFRVGVVPGTVRGRTYYRVGLGQFATLDEANRLRDQLPADVPEGTWPLQL